MIEGIGQRLKVFWTQEIWHTTDHGLKTPKAWLYASCRVISITGTVYKETKAGSRAAALAFSSLLGLGPLVAIAILITGIVLGDQYRDQAIHQLDRALQFVAPQVNQYESLSDGDDQQVQAAQTTQSNPKLVELMNGFIAGARSGEAGVLGVISLIVVVLLLFTSIETVFNEIWGVREGRAWLTRIVFYWTLVTLGAVLLFAALALVGAGTFLNVFKNILSEKVTFGPQLLQLLRWSLPALGVILLIGILTFFYRAIPNTKVLWRAALVGAVVVAALLIANNYLAFLYLRRVILTKSLYGSLGVLPVLMFGLYIFWLFVLIGGQISYAVQNAHFRNSQQAWGSLSAAMRERLSLAVFLTICRRFHACLPPVSAQHLGIVVRVPSQILNECLNRLVDTHLIAVVAPLANAKDEDPVYQPARPLSRITLGQFRTLTENLGGETVGASLEDIDPIVIRFDSAVLQESEQSFFATTIDDLLSDNPFDHSKPPFRIIGPP